MSRWISRLGMAAVLSAVWTGASLAVDAVYRKNAATAASGAITSISQTEVVIERGGNKETIPANEIIRVRWEGEPARLNIARGYEDSGKLDLALETYRSLLSDATNANIRTDLEFLIARTQARAALADPQKVDEAIKALEGFKTAHADSFRYYEALSYLGRLYMAKPDVANARLIFTQLGQAPWPDYRMAAQIFDARLKLQAGDVHGALSAFEQVAAATPAQAGPAELSRKYEALLGKATCLTRKEQYAEAAQVLDEVVKQVPADETRIQAEAYVRQGDALQAQGKIKEAVLAYLHVDVLFPGETELHAEALYHLARLSASIDHPERGAEARARLEQDYANSPWAKKLAGGG